MKKILILICVLVTPILARAESISSFSSDITLSKDGYFDVEETIVYDFGEEERHGIFRTIPTEHSQESPRWFGDRVIEVEVQSVSMDQQSVPFSLDEEFGELNIKIGDPDRTISGVHTYTIEYRVRGALYYYDSGEVELYWNATGNSWEVPIESAVARVHNEDGIATGAAHCYFGGYGADNECQVNQDSDHVTFGSVRLSAGEGLTIAQNLDASAVEKLTIDKLSFWPLWLIGAVLWFIGLSLFLYRYLVKYRTHRSIIAQYEPYEDFKPMYTGLLFDGRIDTKDITAGIVYLAEQGYLKIKRIGRKTFWFFETDDYEVTLLRSSSELDAKLQQQILALLFDPSLPVGSTVVLSELAKNTAKQKENLQLLGGLRKAAESDLIKNGFFEYGWRLPLLMMLALLVTLAALLGITAFLGAELVMPIIISAVVFVVSLVALLLSYRRRTRKGYLALDYLKGFKQFLSVAEKERYQFHNAPQKSPEQFMEYLPYAIAFGVEKEWALVFKDVTLPEPDWYEGQGTNFNAIYLSQSLGSFSSAVASTSTTASSGGGSSGGGAGGGGGGSW